MYDGSEQKTKQKRGRYGVGKKMKTTSKCQQSKREG